MSKCNTRLNTPLVREERRASPCHLGRGARPRRGGISPAVSKHGPQAFGLFSCSKTTNEMNYLAQKFARVVVGSNNIDSCNRT